MKAFLKSPIFKIIVGFRYSNFRYFCLIFIPHFLTALLEGGSFGFILLAFSAIEGKPPPSNLAFLSIADWGWASFTGIRLFYFYVLAAVAFQIIRGLISFIALHGTSLFSLKVQQIAQKQVYEQIFKLSFPFVSKYKIGDLNEYVKAPANFIHTIFESLNRFSVSIFMILGILLFLFLISPLLTIITLFLFGVFALAQKMILKNVIRASGQFTAHLYEFNHQVLQSLQGMRQIHIFHKQEYILKKNEGLLASLVRSTKKVNLLNNTFPTINETVSVLLVGVILIVGSFLLAKDGNALLSSLLTYIALSYRLATRLHMAMAALGNFGVCYGSIERMNHILDETGKEYLPSSGEECTFWNHQIEFKNVSFQYQHTSRLALNQVSFVISKGTMTAIVGLSGAGKSSVLDLILGLQEPLSGEVLIDSQPLHHFTQESWRKRIGVVSQDSFVFNDTIEENIRFGDTSASIDQVHHAAKLAGIADFVHQLPDRYKTVIGERGYKLSGGERQRLALARVMLKDPEILILDEATSNLDSLSELMIQTSLDQMCGKTLIVVAHRLSTIIKADQIIVLENGKIIEKGQHEDLLRQRGRYGNLWDLQTEYSANK